MIQPKPEITNTLPAHHGAFDYDELRQLGYSPDEVIDFSVNSNPYGPPPGVREATARVPLDRYPDRECIALREKLAARHHVEIENIVVGNGTAELLLLVALAFLRPGDRVTIPDVTFSEYERVASIAGAAVQSLTWMPENGHAFFDPQVQMQDAAARFAGVRLVFLCNPNNPDGTHLPASWIIEHWLAKHPETLFVIDEAYANFLLEPESAIEQMPPNLIAVRSLTKDYALAGLRLGYAVGHPEIIEAVCRVRPAWNVNGLAQAAGLAVLDQDSWLRETVHQLHDDKRQLVTGLRSLGLEPLPSSVHYFLLNVGDGAAFRSKLLQHKIMVRDCASFGLPEYVRIATRTPEDNAKLLAAVEMIHA